MALSKSPARPASRRLRSCESLKLSFSFSLGKPVRRSPSDLPSLRVTDLISVHRRTGTGRARALVSARSGGGVEAVRVEGAEQERFAHVVHGHGGRLLEIGDGAGDAQYPFQGAG